MYHGDHTTTAAPSRSVLSFLNVLGVWSLVLRNEVVVDVAGQPDGELGHLLAQAVDRLLVHVCLSDELRQRD